MVEQAIIYYQKNGQKELNGKIKVMFNPSTYTVSRSVSYSYGGKQNSASPTEQNNEPSSRTQTQAQPNQSNVETLPPAVTSIKDYPKMQYTGGSCDALSLELILNTYEFKHMTNKVSYTSSDLDITPTVIQLKKLTLLDATLHQPPLCRFEWSSFHFTGYVVSMNVAYTMFLDDGTPVRAKVSLSIQGKEYSEVISTESVPYESPDRTKSRILTGNQQLWEIAQDEYDDPSKWREIAMANNIKNPLDIESGTRLTVPAIKN